MEVEVPPLVRMLEILRFKGLQLSYYQDIKEGVIKTGG